MTSDVVVPFVVALVGESERLCGELVQVVVGGLVFAERETGKVADVGRLSALSPTEKVVQNWLICENLRGRLLVFSVGFLIWVVFSPILSYFKGDFKKIIFPHALKILSCDHQWVSLQKWSQNIG